MIYTRNLSIPNNVAFTTEPKFKNPFTGKYTTDYFVPAVKYQLSLRNCKYNFIVICCSPTWNGVWRYPNTLTSNFTTWMNGKNECYYVPIAECEKIKDLTDITKQATVDEIIKLQEAWYKGEVKNHPEYKNKRPDWMLKK